MLLTALLIPKIKLPSEVTLSVLQKIKIIEKMEFIELSEFLKLTNEKKREERNDVRNKKTVEKIAVFSVK